MKDSRALRESQRSGWDRQYSAPSPLWRGPPEVDIEVDDKAAVLELGCGDGKSLASLVGGRRFVVGVDYSRAAIRSCLKRYLPCQSLSLAVGDVCSLPFVDRSFDVVIASHVLEHLVAEDRHKAVAECRRVLRGGGTAIVRVFSRLDMRFGKGREIEENTFVRGNSIVYHYFSRTEIRQLFSDFETESLEEREVKKRFDGKDESRVTLEGVFRAT